MFFRMEGGGSHWRGPCGAFRSRAVFCFRTREEDWVGVAARKSAKLDMPVLYSQQKELCVYYTGGVLYSQQKSFTERQVRT